MGFCICFLGLSWLPSIPYSLLSQTPKNNRQREGRYICSLDLTFADVEEVKSSCIQKRFSFGSLWSVGTSTTSAGSTWNYIFISFFQSIPHGKRVWERMRWLQGYPFFFFWVNVLIARLLLVASCSCTWASHEYPSASFAWFWPTIWLPTPSFVSSGQCRSQIILCKFIDTEPQYCTIYVCIYL